MHLPLPRTWALGQFFNRLMPLSLIRFILLFAALLMGQWAFGQSGNNDLHDQTFSDAPTDVAEHLNSALKTAVKAEARLTSAMSLAIVNPAPVFTSVPITSVNLGDLYSYLITISGVDEDELSLSAPTLPSWLTLTQRSGSEVITIAGTGTNGFVNGAGSTANFSFPTSIATDAAGNAYVADQFNHSIRKITPSGEVTTLAGNGARGSADGIGTAASFNEPIGIAVGPAGNIYVADFDNNKIRKITPSGVVTTLAGTGATGRLDGPAASATFNFPHGVTVDDQGNVYVADLNNHSIRKITTDGMVSTLAGSGSPGFANGNGTSARFHDPRGVAVDEEGNVYVADHDNHRIRLISPTGDVTTFAGSGSQSFADGPANSAAFNFPIALSFDRLGNLLVADQDNHRIRSIDGEGNVQTIAGTGTQGFGDGAVSAARFSDPTGVSVDNVGNIWIADRLNQRIRLIGGDGFVLTGNTASETPGDYPVLLQADDGNGGTTNQSFTITIIDTSIPQILVSDIIVNNEPGDCGATIFDYGAEATSDAGIADFNFSIPEGSFFDPGTTEVIAFASDNNGNVSQATFTVTVNDIEAPTLVATGITVELDENGFAELPPLNPEVILFQGTFDDDTPMQNTNSLVNWNVTQGNVDVYFAGQFGSPFADNALELAGSVNGAIESKETFTFEPGNYLFSFEARGFNGDAAIGIDIGNVLNTSFTDFTGDRQTVVFEFTVTQTTTGTIRLNEFGGGDAFSGTLLDNLLLQRIADSILISASDNCGITEIIPSATGFGCNELGTQQVTITVRDEAGNEASETVEVQVVDNIAPTFATRESFILLLDENGAASVTPADYNLGTVLDNCGVDRLEFDRTDFGCGDVGFHVINVTAFDASGNATTTQADVEVRDEIAPVFLTRESFIVFLDANGNASLTPDQYNTATIQTNCDLDRVEFSRTDFGCGDVGFFTIDVTAFDGNGLATTTQADVEVRDEIIPVITLIGDAVIEIDRGSAYIEQGANVADNCDAPLVIGGFVDINTPGTYLITYNAVDENGNPAQEVIRTVNVIQVDVEGPVITANDLTVFTRDDRCSAVVDDYGVTATDESGVDDITFSFNPGTVFSQGTTPVTVTATDVFGNSSSATFNVTVIDNVAPFLLPNDVTVELNELGEGELIVPSAPQVIFSDDFEGDGSGLNLTNLNQWNVTQGNVDVFFGGQFGLPTTNNSLELAGDVNGVIETKNAILFEPGNYRLRIDYRGITGDAAIGVDIGTLLGASITEFTNEFFEPAEFDFTVTETTSATIRLNEFGGTTAGSGTLIDNVRVLRQPDSDGIVFSVFDNCEVTSITASRTDFTCDDLGIQPVTITVADAAGNTTTADIEVNVVDNTAPTLVAQGITLELDENGFVELPPLNQEEILFQGTFDDDNPALNTNSLLNWNVTQGNVDVYFAGQFGSPFADNALELAGSVNGAIESKQAFTLEPGNYLFSFEARGFNGDAAIGIDIGNVLNTSFTDFTGDRQTVVFEFTVTQTTTATIRLNEFGGGDAFSGTLLDNLLLQRLADSILISASDNCGITEITPSVTGFGCNELGTQQVTLTVRDAAGNETSETVEVQVVDNIAPTFATRESFILLLDENGEASVTPDDYNRDTVLDNCGVERIEFDRTEFGCGDVGFHVINVTAFDASGNATTTQADVEVRDEIAPIFLTRESFIIFVDENGVASITPDQYNTGTIQTNCDLDRVEFDRTEFGCGDVGFHVINVTAFDGNGLSTTTQADVEVRDEIAPVFLTRESFILVLDENGIATLNPDQYNTATIQTNCDLDRVEFSRTIFSCSDIGFLTIDVTAFDGNGLATTTQADIEVRDETPPFVNALTRTFGLDENGQVNLVPRDLFNSAFDTCGGEVTVTASQLNFDCNDLGLNEITLTGTDERGNSATFTAFLTVVDAAEPTPVAKDFIIVELDENGQATITADDIDDGSFDNCGIASLEIDITSFDCSNVGGNVVTLTATDVNGNASVNRAQTLVEVRDVTAPVVFAQDISVNLGANGVVNISPEQVNAGATDNCNITSVELDRTVFSCGDIGANTVTLTVRDQSGNFSTAQATVTVNDVTPPFVNALSRTFGLDENGEVNLVPRDLYNSAFDECGGEVTVTASQLNFDCNDLGVNEITLTGTDERGNSATFTAFLTVVDAAEPTPVAKDFIVVELDENGQASITPEDIDNGSFDNCGIASLEIDITSFDCSNIGGNVVTLTATDVNGNASVNRAQTLVEVRDVTAPVVFTQDISVNLDAGGNVTITPEQINAGSTDNCNIVALELDRTAFGCEDLGENTVTLTVRDQGGNFNTGQATVTVNDITAPVVNVQDLFITLDETGNATITADQVDRGSSDACGEVTLSLDRTVFDCDDVGEQNIVTLTVTDESGNSASAQATVNVSDVSGPVLDVQDITVSLDANGQASLPPLTAQTQLFFDDFSADDPALAKTELVNWNVIVGDVDVFFPNQFGLPFSSNALDVAGDVNGAIESKQAFTFEPGDYRLTFTVLGNNGDARLELEIGDLVGTTFTEFIGGTIESRSVDFTVTSTTTATIVFSEFGDAPFFSGTTIDDVELSRLGETLVVFADDACGVASITADRSTFGCGDIGVQTVILTATDVNGNTTNATASVTVVDSLVPTVLTQDITLSIGADGNASILPQDVDAGTTDNCDFTLSLSQTDFNCATLGENIVTLTATDGSGNSASTEAVVTVVDAIGPAINAVPIEVQLDENGQASISAADVEGSIADNCGVTTVTIAQTDFTCEDLGSNAVTVTATDINGNTTTGTLTVTVIDIIPPIVATQNVSVELDENGQASITPEDVLILSEDDVERGEKCNVSAAESHAVWLSKYVQSQGTNLQQSRRGGWNWWWRGRGKGNDDDDGDDDDDNDNGPKPENTRFVFDENGGMLQRELDGTATVMGTIVSTEDATDRWVVSLNLTNARNWEEWSALGRSYKDEQNLAGSSFLDWTYYEMGEGSVLTGAGRNAGDVIELSHAPEDFKYGFQLGEAANSKNANFGLSGWFFYTNRQGKKVQGDFNLDVTDCAALPLPEGTVITSDNCEIATIEVDNDTFGCNELGENTVQVTVTDQSGNASTQTAIVTVSDNLAPVARAKDITVSLGADGTVTIDPAAVDNGSSDNCEIVSFSLSQDTFDCSDIGGYGYGNDDDDDDDEGWGWSYRKKNKRNKVTLTVTDAAGNSDSAEAFVTVVDDAGPVISDDPIILVVYGRRKERLRKYDVFSRVTDNCEVKSVWFPRTRFDRHDAGLNEVQVKATDIHGNVTMGVVKVEVIDISSYPRKVELCYNGSLKRVWKHHVQHWLRKGASLGNCAVLSVQTRFNNLAEQSDLTHFNAEPLIELGTFPNPTSGLTTVKFSSDVAGPAQVVVANTTGNQMAELFNGDLEANQNVEVTYDTGELPSGVYIVRLVTAGKIKTLKLMVKK